MLVVQKASKAQVRCTQTVRPIVVGERREGEAFFLHQSTFLPTSSDRRQAVSHRNLTCSAVSRRPFDIVFCGSDNFSCRIFNALYEARSDLVSNLLVVTPPDAKTGRGRKELYRGLPHLFNHAYYTMAHARAAPLSLLAKELGVPTVGLTCRDLATWTPPDAFTGSKKSSLFLTASFGCLVPKSILALYDQGHALNVHPSLLPRYRGAAPIQWTIANGDRESGVTVQELSIDKFDHGRVLAQQKAHVESDATYVDLEERFSAMGGSMLVDVLQNLEQFKANAKEQDGRNASQAPKMTQNHARIRWEEMDAFRLERLQRAIGSRYPLWTSLPGLGMDSLKVSFGGKPTTVDEDERRQPGTVYRDRSDRAVYVSCVESTRIRLDRIKAGSKWVPASEWLNGVAGRLHSDIVSSSVRFT